MKNNPLTLDDLVNAARLVGLEKPPEPTTWLPLDVSWWPEELRKELYFPFKHPSEQKTSFLSPGVM